MSRFTLFAVAMLCAGSAALGDAYTFLWWADGWRGRAVEWSKTLHVQTNHYAAAINVEGPNLPHLGPVAEPRPYYEAVSQSNDVVTEQPPATLRLTVFVEGKRYDCTGAAANQDDEANFPVRIIDSGRFVQRFDLLNARFENSDGELLDAEARIEFVAWPQQLQVLFEIEPGEPLRNVECVIELVAAGKTTRESKRWDELAVDEKAAVGLAWSPTLPTSGEASGVSVADRRTGATLPVVWDPLRAWYRIDLPADEWSVTAQPNHLDRYPIRISNTTNEPQTFNLLFAREGEGLQGITGLCPMLRDSGGNPTGDPVQLSKNWHRLKDRFFLYEGAWIHVFTQLDLEPGEVWEGELAMCYAHWGGVPAASHAQLCLVGWGTNQLWDQAAIGSWGESITYDPDVCLNRSMIDDVRPLMVTGLGGGRWQWTVNVGGGDFLVYVDADRNRQYLTRMRTAYRAHGPNLTDVVYAGVSADGRIAARMQVSTPRCDDVNRAYHRVRYDVLAETSISRLAFYQLGADKYNDHQFSTMAYGNSEGLVEEFPVTAQQSDNAEGRNKRNGRTGYLRTGIECRGSAPWFSLHGAERNNHHPMGAWANRGLVIRSWKARLGGRDVPRPFASVYRTNNGVPSANVELSAPPGLDRLLPGDFVEAEVELIVVPQTDEDYYGPNESLRADLAANGETWKPIHRLARGNDIRVEVETGRLRRRYPPVIEVSAENVAKVRLERGLGYLPITFAGLSESGSYNLELDGEPVDQQDHGNDFWQTGYDAGRGTWSRTYNLNLDSTLDGHKAWQITFRPAGESDVRDISDGSRQLFLDDWIVAESQHVELVPGEVVKHPGNPVIRRDKYWDASRCDLYGNVVYDAEHDRLQLFYSANNVPNGHEDRLAYAESLDGGKIWFKPALDIIPYKGQKRTNLVMLPPALVFAGPCVFRDDHDPDPAKRYKLFTSSYPDTAYLGIPRIYTHRGPFLWQDYDAKLPEGCGAPGMYVAYSPDGFHWTCSGEPFSNMLSDTTQSAFWDVRLGKYVAYVRARTDNGRSVARMESDDFEIWSDPAVVLEGDQSRSLYSMGVTPYQGVYIGTPWIFDQPSEAAGGPVIWPELAVSRDGIRWHRLFEGTPLIPTGESGQADSRQIRLAASFAVLKDRILFAYGQTDQPHSTVDMKVDIGVATMRRDGFAAMSARETEGHLLTKPLKHSGGTLWVNAAVGPGGHVKAEAIDADGRPLDGCAVDECIEFVGNSIATSLAWENLKTIPADCRVRFALRNAKLYSFWITP